MKFKFSEGRSIKGVKAEDAVRELERIYEKDGALRASRVVEEAKPKDAVLHPAFEWRDKVAAHEFRLEQARRLVRAVHVVNEQDQNRSTPVFVHVAATPTQDSPQGDGEVSREGEYHPVSVVIQRVDLFEQALTELEHRMRSAMAAVDALREAAEKSADSDKLTKVALAVRALETASEAIRSLH